MKNKKKVLFLATSKNTRGGITAVLKAYEQFPFWKNYKVYWLETHIDRTILCKLLYAFIALLKYLIIIWRYDIVHIHTSELPSVKRKFFFFRIAKLLHKKVVVHLHIGTQIDDMAGNFFYKNLFEGADAIIVLSQTIRTKLDVLFGIRNKVFVIYNPSPVVSSVHYTDKYKEIVFAGTLNKNKGYSVLIKAFSLIANEFPDWKLVIAGNGELANAKKLALDSNLVNQVSFLGWIKGQDKDIMFRRASIFCLASYAEGFPMAVLDACAYGVPIVSTPVGGLPDILLDNKSVLFFNSGNVSALARQLKRLILDKDLRISLSKASLQLSKELFCMDNINSQIDRLYKTL